MSGNIHTFGNDSEEHEEDVSCTPLLSEQWHRELDTLSGTSRVRASDVELLFNGDRALDTWRRVLSEARHSIRLYTYYFSGRERVGRELLDIIEKKAKEGVSVRILAARYAQTACGPGDVLRLRRAGCRIVLTGNIGFRFPGRKARTTKKRLVGPVPPGIGSAGSHLIDFSLHAKILIVDGCSAITGGRNIQDRYFLSWKDADIFLTGPAASDLARRFDYEFSTLGGAPPFFPSVPESSGSSPGIFIRSILSNPWEHAFTTMETVIHAVKAARQSIMIMTQYIIPPPALLKALSDAAKRGVAIDIITNSPVSGKAVAGGLCWYISSNWYAPLLEAGVRVHEWQGIERVSYLHTKFFLVDEAWLALGSFNLSVRSSYLESEILCTLTDSRYTGEASDVFRDYLSRGCREVTLEETVRYSFHTRRIQRAALLFRNLY